jgi:hypothetical protein
MSTPEQLHNAKLARKEIANRLKAGEGLTKADLRRIAEEHNLSAESFASGIVRETGRGRFN